jgi:hypothetical protein
MIYIYLFYIPDLDLIFQESELKFRLNTQKENC